MIDPIGFTIGFFILAFIIANEVHEHQQKHGKGRPLSLRGEIVVISIFLGVMITILIIARHLN